MSDASKAALEKEGWLGEVYEKGRMYVRSRREIKLLPTRSKKSLRPCQSRRRPFSPGEKEALRGLSREVVYRIKSKVARLSEESKARE